MLYLLVPISKNHLIGLITRKLLEGILKRSLIGRCSFRTSSKNITMSSRLQKYIAHFKLVKKLSVILSKVAGALKIPRNTSLNSYKTSGVMNAIFSRHVSSLSNCQ